MIHVSGYIAKNDALGGGAFLNRFADEKMVIDYLKQQIAEGSCVLISRIDDRRREETPPRKP